jgi:hypothetical protein
VQGPQARFCLPEFQLRNFEAPRYQKNLALTRALSNAAVTSSCRDFLLLPVIQWARGSRIQEMCVGGNFNGGRGWTCLSKKQRMFLVLVEYETYATAEWSGLNMRQLLGFIIWRQRLTPTLSLLQRRYFSLSGGQGCQRFPLHANLSFHFPRSLSKSSFHAAKHSVANSCSWKPVKKCPESGRVYSSTVRQ